MPIGYSRFIGLAEITNLLTSVATLSLARRDQSERHFAHFALASIAGPAYSYAAMQRIAYLILLAGILMTAGCIVVNVEKRAEKGAEAAVSTTASATNAPAVR